MKSMIFALCLVAVADDELNYISVAADPSPIMCINATGNATAVTCAAGETKCHGPSLNILTGLSNDAPGCGPCPTDPVSKTCAECAGNNKTACNDVKEGKTFSCYDHTYNKTANGFEQAVNATTCHRLMDGPIVCNSPTTDAATNYTTVNNGCGPCVANTTANCVECNKDGCNSAASLTAFLLPLVAFFYTLC